MQQRVQCIRREDVEVEEYYDPPQVSARKVLYRRIKCSRTDREWSPWFEAGNLAPGDGLNLVFCGDCNIKEIKTPIV